VFPSPHGDSPEYGVKLRKVDGVFSGGKNEREARGVVEAALTHLRTRPGESLGIVAMNRDQANLIEELFEKLIKSDPLALSQREALDNRHERVFVKNLENVQGDERDVIIISITYGPDEMGVVKKNFGPINLSTGWRRLNVLFTRARRRVEVFSSMTDEDLNLGPGASRGSRSLKNYLEFARAGKLSAINYDVIRPPGSPFEEQVVAALSQKGFDCEIQLGVANYFIDIAVRNPKRLGSFLLGIECDGATYHSHKSARDRDRLRQMVLERMSWRIHRIWSTDWFRSPHHQVERILQAIEVAQKAADQEVVTNFYVPFDAFKSKNIADARQISLDEPVSAPTSSANLSEQETSIESYALERGDTGRESNTTAEFPRVEEISANTWFRLAKWAKETNRLAPWQRSLAYSLGRSAALDQHPSPKQTLHGATILDQATKLGFRSVD
jgi:very-short-patch-repair endonuclease